MNLVAPIRESERLKCIKRWFHYFIGKKQTNKQKQKRHTCLTFYLPTKLLTNFEEAAAPRGGTLRISGCGCATRTLEPLAHTRASFSWILLPNTRVNSWFPWSSQPTGQFHEK